MIEFTNIYVGTPISLHPYLSNETILSVGVMIDGELLARTSFARCGSGNGIWEIPGSLQIPRYDWWLNLVIEADGKGYKQRFHLAPTNVQDLIARVRSRPDGSHQFRVCAKCCSPSFLMNCSIKIYLPPVDTSSSHVVASTIPTQSANYKFGDDAVCMTRKWLNVLYKQNNGLLNEDKAARISGLGNGYYNLYEENREKVDLEKAIALHKEALVLTSRFGPEFAEGLGHLSRCMEGRYDLEGDPMDIQITVALYELAIGVTKEGDPRKAWLLNNMARCLESRFNRSDVLVDMDEAILRYQNAVELTPDDHPQKLGRLINLGNGLHRRFNSLKSLKDLEKAISSFQRVVELTPDGHTNKPDRLKALGNGLLTRFKRMGSLRDLESAISSYQKAVKLTPDGHVDKQIHLNNLGVGLSRRYECLGSLNDLESAISSYQTAIDLLPEGSPDKPGCLNNLGIGILTRFERIGSLPDLESAISSFQKAVELTPDVHTDKPGHLNNLGNGLRVRFERLGSLQDLECAISSYQTAVDLMPDGHIDKSRSLSNLGIGLRTRFERLGNLKDLEHAISSDQTAVNLIPEGHPDKPGSLNNLGNGLLTYFERLGSLKVLGCAISSYQTAVNLIPDSHPDKPGSLENLGNGLLTHFKRLGSLEILERAILNYQNAVKLTPNGHPDRPSRLDNLANGLLMHFEQLGSFQDLKMAISNHQRAVELTPDSHKDKPSRLNNLANGLRARFKYLGSLEDLEGTISSYQKAVKLTPNSHTDKPIHLNNLGIGFRTRFERLGSLEDLESAISSYRNAIDLMPDGHLDKPGHLSNLGNSLLVYFERIGSLQDLESAISSYQTAVDLIPGGHLDKPGRLNNLGNGLLTRFERLGSLKDLESAILNYQTAIELTPDCHTDKPGRLNNLGVGLRTRFECMERLEDLEGAILSHQNAVDLMPDGQPGMPMILSNLGSELFSRFKCLNNQQDLDNALVKLELAANSVTGSPRIRFNAAKKWAECAEMFSIPPIPAYQCAIDLLPRIAWLGIPVPDQHTLLADVGAVVRDAVKSAVILKQYETAVEWAEQGRSVVWQNLLGLRTPLDKLRVDNPRLASRLQDLSQKLETPPVSITSGQVRPRSNEDVTQTYFQLAIEWDKAVEEVRLIQGFESFLRAKKFSELAPVAHEGPVVILNDHSFHADALVLIPDESDDKHISVINIPLEDFTSGLGKRLFLDLKRVLSKAGVRSRDIRQSERVESAPTEHAAFSEILQELWLKVAKPVIDGLGYQDKKGTPSRVWWCPTGSLAFLPIHAAGLYGTGEASEKVSDYFISSYTPTLTAILDQSNPVISEDFRILAVAEPSTSKPIPKTEDEVKLIENLSGGLRFTGLMNEKATVNVVLQEMKESHWIHLACHGQQRIDDPMKSGFLLHGGNTLTLSEIVRKTLPKADFAFLSACETAMGDEKVAEESAHLAAGMLLSGCKGVIATMWSIRDEDGPKVAGDVYRRILKDGRPNRKGAAFALQEATKRLREEVGVDFISWVPFIHIGR